MNLQSLLKFWGLSPPLFRFAAEGNVMMLEPEQLVFSDDGIIPNNRLPLLLYRNVFAASEKEGASWLEQRFAVNNWSNAWRNGIYGYHHYHSTAHEVLGIYAGAALLHLGGEQGEKVQVEAGDVIVIPAGVGHKNLHSKDLGVVGAYAGGRDYDLNKGLPGERPQADDNIATVPLPEADPLFGKTGGLMKIWH